jgi:molybdopterin-guanine dinucleotide biosynthesis protein A
MVLPADPGDYGPGFCAVLLAGGRAVRLDGADKASVEYLGRTLLEHAIEALVDASEVVVVGDPVPTTRPVTFTRENPRYGGPVAALLTGRDALVRKPTTLGVLAVDMPWVTPWTFRRLHEAAAGHDGAFLTDASGRRQLAGVLDAALLDRIRPDHEGQHGMALHRLIGGLDLADVAPEAAEGRDVDTWADLRDLQADPPGFI